MRLDKEGLEHLKRSEALRLEPYYDVKGVPTIGYGNTYYEDGTKVRITDPAITVDRAESLYMDVVSKFEKAVEKYVKVDLNQYQFNALVSFTYNVGIEAFRTSTLLKVVNSNPDNYTLIKAQLFRWVNSGGNYIPGLLNRRKKEFEMYSKKYAG